MDPLVSWLESLEVPSWVFGVLFLTYVAYYLLRVAVRGPKLRIRLEISKRSRYVDFQLQRVFESIIYDVKYPDNLLFPSLWQYELGIELPQSLQSVQIERVGYIHPGQDLETGDEIIEFSQLGKLIVDHESIRQVVPHDAVKRAFLLNERVEKFLLFTGLKIYSFNIHKLKGVSILVMEISYPIEEMKENKYELVQVEDHPPINGILRFIIRKKKHLKQVNGYVLRYPLPHHIKSFALPVEYYPPEANLNINPEDISITSTCKLHQFERNALNESYQLNWIFNITHDVIDVRFRYNEV